MLHDVSLLTVWAPMIRILCGLIGVSVDNVFTHVEHRPLERTIDTPEMGVFEQGTLGAFRFEVTGWVDGHPLVAVEHVTRIVNAIPAVSAAPPGALSSLDLPTLTGTAQLRLG
jgi:2,4-diaminopentanoate dehydrogenase